MTKRQRRILVIANETVENGVLGDAIRARGRAKVLIVAPALNSRVRHWLSDEDAARRAAQERVVRCLEHLRADGIDADGLVGDADPMQAIADALRVFPADEIVIAVDHECRPHWPTRELVERARRSYQQSVLVC